MDTRTFSVLAASLVLLVSLIGKAEAAATSSFNASVESQVREAFADAPIMIDVARCESRFRQFNDISTSSTPVALMGGYQKKMVGIFQIFGQIHRAEALKRGMDIDTIAGNIAYARYLYDRQGTLPWEDSSPCWRKPSVHNASSSVDTVPGVSVVDEERMSVIATSAVPLFPTKTLKFGMIDPEVVTVQKLLNSGGYTVAIAGPGAPGNETEKFGALTREAIRKFQCSKNIVCSGSEETTGYGLVGTKTRMALSVLAYVSK